ncbi:MAG: DNA polymerase I, partial [Chloroflexota bacterium]
ASTVPVAGSAYPPEVETTTITRVVSTRAGLEELTSTLAAADRFAVDTDTTSTDPLRAVLVGLSFATEPGAAWYVPVGHAEGTQLPLPVVMAALRPMLEAPNRRKVGHNIKYDYQVLAHHGLVMNGLYFDTMIAAFLINSVSRGLSLSALALARLNIEMTPIEALIGKGKTQITMDEVAIDTVARYAGADAAVTLQLMENLTPEILNKEVDSLFHDVEMPLVPVLGDMELQGVALDTSVLTSMSQEMTETLGGLEERIFNHVGRPFNINSTQQLGQILFQELKLPSGRRTKTGYSTDNEVLEGLRGKHPLVDDILEYRQLIKLKNTYVDALPSLINPEDQRVHTDFNQTVASTGRLSSSNPNLQNIPIRGEMGRKIRRAFVPSRPENVLLAADYSQIELRILASMSGDERLLHAFLTGEDIHRATASAVFGVALDKVTADQRRIAKVVNFGIIYGIGEARLAHETGIERGEATEFIANYNRTYAGVKAFMDTLRKQAAFSGYVSTLLQRRRYTPEIHSSNPGVRAAAERAAINMPIQGTAADIIKVAMIRLHLALTEQYPEAHMVLQVHDELVFDIPRDLIEPVGALVRETMEHALELKVPIEVEMKVGRDWYDMTDIDRRGG